MDKQVTVAIIGAIALISTAAFFTPLGTFINSHLFNPESVPVLTSFEPDKESPQMTETQINWTATANNPRKEALFYNFNLNGPSTNYNWKNVQKWGTQKWWSWYPILPGDYNIEVQVTYGKKDETPDSKMMNYTIFPFSPTWTAAGYYQCSIGKCNVAIKAYDKAIELNPQDFMALSGKGYALNSLKKFDEAIKVFDKALEINPQSSEDWNNKGFSLEKLGKSDEALKAYDKAVELDARNLLALYNKKRILGI